MKFLTILLLGFLLAKLHSHRDYVKELAIILFSTSETNETYNGVVPYPEIVHTNRMGGLVRDPLTGNMASYNNSHSLWMQKEF